MIDLDTHRIIDILQSREPEDVIKWLMEFPNIRIVSRDGSTTYKNAISAAHPTADQISDKFHLVKNLIKRATLYFQRIFKGRIAIPATAPALKRHDIIRNGTIQDKIRLVKNMHKEGQSNAEIHAVTGLGARTVRKYIAYGASDLSKKSKTVREKAHEDAMIKVQAKADSVRALASKGLSNYQIVKATGFTKNTVAKYLSDSFTPVNAHYGKLREGKLAPYRETVLSMRTEGLTYETIAEYIREQGYTGSVAALRRFVTKERRITADLYGSTKIDTELIERKRIIQLLYRPVSEIKGITQKQYHAIITTYPETLIVYTMVKRFRNLIKSKDPRKLLTWMTDVKKYSIKEFDSFLSGITQDVTAVKNSIRFPYNNGLAEGSVNKLKVIKRIMYGRCSFELLRKKLIMWDRWKHIN